ncbi:MAG TPA: hypothetical protein VEZ70_04755 [Allosphingosinicella sp.]|nr:hypothetical protein [Allosphingosinicella sp.]
MIPMSHIVVLSQAGFVEREVCAALSGRFAAGFGRWLPSFRRTGR